MAKRQPNFSGEEVEVLVGQVEKHGKMLFGSFGPGVSSAAKEKVWEDIRSKVSAVGGVRRSATELKKKWAVVKSSAKTKAASINRERVRTGGGQSAESELSAAEERVVGMISSVVVKGVNTGFDSADDMLQSVSYSTSSTSSCDPTPGTSGQAGHGSDGVSGMDGSEVDAMFWETVGDADLQSTSSEPLTAKETGCHPVPAVQPISAGKTKGRGRADQLSTLVNLQQQTLGAVHDLLLVQRERLAVDRERLALEQEMVQMKRLKLIESGWVLTDQGWVLPVAAPNTEE